MRPCSRFQLRQRIPVRTVGLRDHRYHFLPLGSVLYFFAGGAAGGNVAIPGYAPTVFQRGRVYARTRSSVYATCFHTISTLIENLDLSCFGRAHRSILVNLRQVEMFDPGRGTPRIGFRLTQEPFEWIPVAGSCVRQIRKSLGLPVSILRVPADHALLPLQWAGVGPH